MTIEEKIRDDLRANGRSTVNEIASRIDYSNGYVRRNAKEMRSDGEIEGAKATRVPAVIIHGNFEVLSGNRDYLLDIVKRYAPSKHDRAKKMSVENLRELIRDEIAEQVVGGPFRWEFWV
jgi:DNA-binding Lrp family transcriptional regulator